MNRGHGTLDALLTPADEAAHKAMIRRRDPDLNWAVSTYAGESLVPQGSTP